MKSRIQYVLIFFLIALFLSHVQQTYAAVAQNNEPSKETNVTVPSVPEFDFEKLDETSPEDHFYSDFINMLMTLGMLIGLLLFVSWFLKRMMRSRTQHLNTSSEIKIIEQRQLTAKSTIHLVEIGGKTFALGESHSNIVLIGEFPSLGGGVVESE